MARVRRVPPAELGPVLFAARQRCGLSARACARAVGITHVYLLGLEAARYCPSAPVAEALAGVLGLGEGERAVLAASIVPEVGYGKPGRVRRLVAR